MEYTTTGCLGGNHERWIALMRKKICSNSWYLRSRTLACRIFKTAGLFFCVLSLCGCREENEKKTTTRCEPLHENESICAGVEKQVLGSETWYVDETGTTSCTSIVYVKQGAKGGNGSQESPFGDLPAAVTATAADSGACIALAAGEYSPVQLPASVSLLGKGSAKSKVIANTSTAIGVNGGENALIRGVLLTGTAPGIVVENAENLRIESTAVDNTLGLGIDIRNSVGIRIRQVQVTGVKPATDASGDVGVGIRQRGAGSVSVENSLVENCMGSGLISYEGDLSVSRSVFRSNDGYGIAAACSPDGCVPPRPSVTIEGSLVENHVGVGILLWRVIASVLDNKVTDTNSLTESIHTISRSVEVVEVEDLQFIGNTLSGGADMGLFLHATSGVLSQNAVAMHGGRGIWMQSFRPEVPDMVEIHDNHVSDNKQVGVGVLGNYDVRMNGGSVIGTVTDSVFTEGGTVVQGDAVQLLMGSVAVIESMTFQSNERISILADAVEFLSVKNNEFIDEIETPIAVQEVGVESISEAIDLGILETEGNVNALGIEVSPYLPNDPWNNDKREIAVSPAMVVPN